MINFLLITLVFLFIVIPIGGLITMLISEKGNKDTYVEGLMGEKRVFEEFEEFEYLDIDYLNFPSGFLESKLQNRLDEGYCIQRDEKRMSWRGWRTRII